MLYSCISGASGTDGTSGAATAASTATTATATPSGGMPLPFGTLATFVLQTTGGNQKSNKTNALTTLSCLMA